MMKNLLLAYAFCTYCLSSAVVADPTVKAEPVSLRVQTINASTGEDETDTKIDKRLQNISWKLESLPYKNFSLQSSQTVTVPLKKKLVVRLPLGHQLTLRLLYKNESKLGIWIDWSDQSGMQLLNSKIHLGCTDPMVAGTDNSDGSASLLAIALEKQ